jgi:hypothetical protein
MSPARCAAAVAVNSGERLAGQGATRPQIFGLRDAPARLAASDAQPVGQYVGQFAAQFFGRGLLGELNDQLVPWHA